MNAGNFMTRGEVEMSPNIAIVDLVLGTAGIPAIYTKSSHVTVCFASLLHQIEEFISSWPLQRQKNAEPQHYLPHALCGKTKLDTGIASTFGLARLRCWCHLYRH
jgi:hypothetical protein